MLENILRQIISEKKQQAMSKSVMLNFLKEYIQYLVLSSLYNHKKFKKLVFKGGSCLRICFDLPRLSEDLDFDYDIKLFSVNILEELETYLSQEIKNKYYSSLDTKIQSNTRLYLKFPFLYNLGISQKPDSDKLYVKIEISDTVSLYAGFEMTPVSKFGFNFIAYHYDLPSLMAGKIHAIIKRLWFKGEKQEIDIKGRDFYDLFWFLKNGISPNWKMLKKYTGIKNEKELKTVLNERIKQIITPQKLIYDLQNFIPDQGFVSDFSKNYPEIMKKYL